MSLKLLRISLFVTAVASTVQCANKIPTDASTMANKAPAYKIVVEDMPCDIDLFIVGDVTRCIQYRGKKCHDFIMKGTNFEDRGEFDCDFKLVSSNATGNDRTRIKITGGTIKYDMQFTQGFNDKVCKDEQKSDSLLSGLNRWTFWRPDQDACSSWAISKGAKIEASPSATSATSETSEAADSVDSSAAKPGIKSQPALPQNNSSPAQPGKPDKDINNHVPMG